MADYFDEMGWRPLGEGEEPNHLLHFARLLRDFGMFEQLSEHKRLPPPASKDFVINLKKETIDTKDVKCPVCLKDYNLAEVVTVLPCNHRFHPDCILPWLGKTNSCPLCRCEMPTDDENYEMYRKEKLRAKQRKEDIKNLHNSMFS